MKNIRQIIQESLRNLNEAGIHSGSPRKLKNVDRSEKGQDAIQKETYMDTFKHEKMSREDIKKYFDRKDKISGKKNKRYGLDEEHSKYSKLQNAIAKHVSKILDPNKKKGDYHYQTMTKLKKSKEWKDFQADLDAKDIVKSRGGLMFSEEAENLLETPLGGQKYKERYNPNIRRSIGEYENRMDYHTTESEKAAEMAWKLKPSNLSLARKYEHKDKRHTQADEAAQNGIHAIQAKEITPAMASIKGGNSMKEKTPVLNKPPSLLSSITTFFSNGKFNELVAEEYDLDESLDMLDEAVFGPERYEWRTYNHDTPSVITTKKGRKHTLSKGSVFGVRKATSDATKHRIITKEHGPSIVFSYRDNHATRLKNRSVNEEINESVKVRDFSNFSGDVEKAPLVPVKVGDVVGFKSDIEQYGKVIAINGSKLTLHNPNGFSGEYLRNKTKTIQEARDCWIEKR